MEEPSTQRMDEEPVGEFEATEELQFGPGFAGQLNAAQDLAMTQAGAILAVAGRDAEISYGGAQVIVAGNDVEVAYGGAMVMVVGGDAALANGGAGLVVGENTTVRAGTVGVALTGQLNLEEGSKVILSTPQAIALGAAFGAACGLVSWLLRRK